MELMDRELQRQLLAGLAAAYPATVDPMELGLNSDDPRWTFNAMYLAEHDLVDAQVVRDLTAGDVIARARITAKGLDFLQDDGGLGAILNTVTVRFEAETLRALIEQKVAASTLPEEQKSKLIRWAKSAGNEALKEATKRRWTLRWIGCRTHFNCFKHCAVEPHPGKGEAKPIRLPQPPLHPELTATTQHTLRAGRCKPQHDAELAVQTALNRR